MAVNPNQEAIELFITRYDRSGDRRLCFEELSQAFLPHDSFYGHTLKKRTHN